MASARRDALGAVVSGPVGLPERTLGWAVLEWTVEYLRQPDGPDAGTPWRFTPEQVPPGKVIVKPKTRLYLTYEQS